MNKHVLTRNVLMAAGVILMAGSLVALSACSSREARVVDAEEYQELLQIRPPGGTQDTSPKLVVENDRIVVLATHHPAFLFGPTIVYYIYEKPLATGK